MKNIKIIMITLGWLVFSLKVHSETLDLTTGKASITAINQITLENFSIGDDFYNATIQLNLDGSFQVTRVETLSLLPTAKYEVKFSTVWSEQTHPDNFPKGQAHFSGLIGATHKLSANLWKEGQEATLGIESMAETGSKSSFNSEINTQILRGTVQNILSGGGVGFTPGEVRLEFGISPQYPFVTLVSMIAPSPDWFVGVYDLSLISKGQWIDELTIPLYAYDAGSDNGILYKSLNSDTQPKSPIQKIETTPFLVNGITPTLGTFTFKRLD